MIHFRPRRFFRLAVDLLSLNFAGAFVRSRFAPPLARGVPVGVSTFFQPAEFPQRLCLASPEVRTVRRRTRDDGSRYLASTGILIALSLEACGCNPAGDTNFAPDLLDVGRTVQAAHVEQALSFYEPSDQSTSPSSSRALTDIYSGPRPIPVEAKSAPWDIPESVYLVYRSRRPGELMPPRSPIASAFVLSVPSPGSDGRASDRPARFLVTARHVVDPQWAQCSDRNPASIDLRLNRRVGGTGYETVPLRSGTSARFFTPADPTADLAVIPLDRTLIARLDDYKFLDLPFRILLTSSDMPLLHLEQPVMTVGLSAPPQAEPANFPVFDAGSLARMPSEAVGVRCGTAQAKSRSQPARSTAKLLHVWFIDAGVPPGVSGAPVFTSIARGPDAVKTPVLLGVQSVVWAEEGVAGITPSPLLAELVQSALRGAGPGPSTDRSP